MNKVYKLYKLFLIIGLVFSFTDVPSQICVGTPGEVTWSYWRELPDDQLGELYADEFYPERPDGFRIINSIQSPVNYDNQFGSVIRGFINIPVTEAVEFNITGDDKVRFYLSTDEDPANVNLEAYMDNYSNREEHDKYPEQTTQLITLNGGQHYYFELHHVEDGGGDHVSLWWKTSFTGLTNWNFVSSQYISSVDCTPPVCPDRGTPCDDGDASTTDDIEDGHCNCTGMPQSVNSCIGERGRVEAYYYDQIPGGDLDDLYEDPQFPSMPGRYELLEMMGIEARYEADSFGTLVQAFLTVPVTGNYQFNITSNSDGIFFLSSNDDPALKQTHQILTTSSTGTVEHDKYIYQSTAELHLESGQYYFFEINHKESSWQEHYNIFWKTPYSPGDHWKRIPAIYIYDYSCELACISEGTPCDDLDPFTNDDAFDANCNCVGTPCNGPDCDDPIANYIPYPECGLTDQMDNRADASWLSCSTSLTPNPVHGNTHWLQYDLGGEHVLWGSHVWNYNVTGGVSEGFQNVAIDYSIDGVNWTSLGTYNWPLASGDPSYSGFIGPDFGGVRAQYILVASLDGASGCRGISKMTFTTQECGPEDTICDDGNPNTINDRYDADCNCTGYLTTYNDCSQDTLMLGDSLLNLQRYSAIRFLASSSNVDAGSSIQFIANEKIELMPGFEGATGALLTLEIDDCTQVQSLTDPIILSKLKENILKNELVVFSFEDTADQVIGFYVATPGHVTLEIRDKHGNVRAQLLDHHIKNVGYFTKKVRTKRLKDVTYQVHLTTQGDHLVRRMDVTGK